MADDQTPKRRPSSTVTISLDAILERLQAKRVREAWLRARGVLVFTRRKKADTPR